MIVTQRSPILFAPQMTTTAGAVFNGSPTVDSVTREQLIFARSTGTGWHQDYFCEGANLEDLAVSWQSVADGINLADFPLIKRGTGITSLVQASFTNGRGVTDFMEFDFTNKAGSTVYLQGATSVVADTYMEYSLARTKAIFDDLTGPSMYDESGNRAFTSTIPHASFTCHAYGGGWSVMGGLRFTAITPRHLIGVSHYGYNVGDIIQFRTVANVPVYAEIQAKWRPSDYTANQNLTDIQMFLLTEDLPASITPAPIVGNWFAKLQTGSTATSSIFWPQYAGLNLWNNDGHITPTGHTRSYSRTLDMPSYTTDGVSVVADKDGVFREAGAVTISGENLIYNDALCPFYHSRRGGDSGSPCFAPVDGGWALCAIVSGILWGDAALNQVIERIDSRAGISTGYTVTVAADPTI